MHSKRRLKRPKKWLSILVPLACLLVLMLVFSKMLMAVARFSVDTCEASRRLSRALDGARSVAFVEYTEHDGDRVRITATSEQIAQFRRATTYWLMPSRPKPGLCFNPHHRVEIVKADGSLFKFAVCFECNDFELDDPPWRDLFVLPDQWNESLASLFKSMKMAPFGPYDQTKESK